MKKQNFSLIEMLAVIAIMSILLTITVSFAPARDRRAVNAAAAQIGGEVKRLLTLRYSLEDKQTYKLKMNNNKMTVMYYSDYSDPTTRKRVLTEEFSDEVLVSDTHNIDEVWLFRNDGGAITSNASPLSINIRSTETDYNITITVNAFNCNLRYHY